MDFTKTIETERLILRKFTNDDINNVYKNYASKDVVTEFLTWETHSSIDVTTEYISNVVIPSYENEEYNWAVEYKETHEVVGAISVVNINKDTKMAEIGWCLDDSLWGKGIMPEAGRAVIEHLKEMGFVRIQGKHNVANPKSGKALMKLGMTFEGVLKKYSRNNKGQLVDCAIYAMINEEN